MNHDDGRSGALEQARAADDDHGADAFAAELNDLLHWAAEHRISLD